MYVSAGIRMFAVGCENVRALNHIPEPGVDGTLLNYGTLSKTNLIPRCHGTALYILYGTVDYQ